MKHPGEEEMLSIRMYSVQDLWREQCKERLRSHSVGGGSGKAQAPNV